MKYTVPIVLSTLLLTSASCWYGFNGLYDFLISSSSNEVELDIQQNLVTEQPMVASKTEAIQSCELGSNDSQCQWIGLNETICFVTDYQIPPSAALLDATSGGQTLPVEESAIKDFSYCQKLKAELKPFFENQYSNGRFTWYFVQQPIVGEFK